MRQASECSFEAAPGARLFYRHWPGASGSPRRALVLFHRGHEHSGRLQHIVDELDLPEFAMFAWDARGHGRSREAERTHPSFAALVQDVDRFVRHISQTYGIAIEDIGIVAQSVSSVLTATWVHDYAPAIRCMVLASPAFRVKLYVPFARQALQAWHAVAGDFHVQSYVKASALTHDPERIASYNADPLIQRPISARVLLSLYSTSERVISDAQAIHVPVQLLISGADYVVRQEPQFEFFEKLGSAIKEKQVFDGFYHDTLGERDRAPAIAAVRAFVLRRFAGAPHRPSLVKADREGYTKDEFDQLSRPLPELSPKAMQFAISRATIRGIGRLSSGIHLGIETGFDSGSTLDYVYRNQPSGITPLGKLIDWFYLHSIGWRGIRVRRMHMRQTLALAMEALRAQRAPVRIVDIAAGHGRYILDVLREMASSGDQALLRDYSEINVRQGQALIRQNGMEGFARFEQGDAFDRSSLAALAPRPTLGVVSGLYELFPDNAMVRNSLGGLADAIEPGGYLAYTGQPWHPQLEMIARVLASHRQGKPWIMRRRTQAELDQLVECAGFRKVHQFTDEWGIFTVSLAKRVAP